MENHCILDRKPFHILAMNVVLLSEIASDGSPFSWIQPRMKALTQLVEVASAIGNAAIHLVFLICVHALAL